MNMNIPSSHSTTTTTTTHPYRPLSDILQDPDTKWSDIREGIKSGIGGVGVAKATTNVGIMEALKESLHRESGTSSCNSHVSATSLDDDEDDDEYGEDYELDRMEKMLSDRVDGETKLMADLNLTNGRAPLSMCKVGGKDIKEVAFSNSKEDKNNEVEDGAFANKSKGDPLDDSKNVGRESSEPLQRRRRRDLPARRIQRQSFCASLKEVTEDKEEKANNTTPDDGDGDAVNKTSPGREGSRPERRHSRFRPKQMASLQFPRDNSIRLSSIFNSDTRISLSSFQRSDSIDLMDFGVDHHRGPLFANSNAESARSLATATGESMSNFVDSEGFLGWGGTSNDNTCHNDSDDSSGCDESEHDHDEKEESSTSMTAVGENGNNEISSSGADDSSGFLGWDGRIYDNDSSRKLKPDDDDDGVSATTENEDGKNNEPIAEERNLKAGDDLVSFVHSKIKFGADDGPATADNENEKIRPPIAEVEDSLFGKSWHIEDYEDPNDNKVIDNAPAVTTPKRVRSRPTLTGLITNRLVQSMPVMEIGRWNSNLVDDEPKDEIQTSVVKRILLRNTLFGGIRRKSSDDVPYSSCTFDDYTRPAIIINREDDVDIGELRRELLEAGSKTS